jgi:hypothetical protein
MRLVLTCGDADSEFERVHALLLSAGLSEAAACRETCLTPAQAYDSLFAATQDGHSAALGTPHWKSWAEFATDLVLGNAGSKPWGFADHRTTQLLNLWKEVDVDVRFVLVYTAPNLAIARTLAGPACGGKDLEDQIASWKATTDAMLRFYHRNHSQCILVDEQQVVFNPEAFVAKVAQRFDIPLSAAALPPTQNGATCLVSTCIAAALIGDDPGAASLWSELVSSADMWEEQADDQATVKERLLDEYTGLLTQAQDDARTHEVTSQRLRRVEIDNANLIAQLTDERTKLTGRVRELDEYAELLGLQVDQLKEENIALVARTEATTRLAASLTHADEVLYDLRNAIEGENWYPAESDGRWAGPGLDSTLKVAPFRHACVQMELDIVDAMDNDMLREMKVTINGCAVDAEQQWNNYPTTVISRFDGNRIPESTIWSIRFQFPKTMSPSERGSSDRRPLAIRFRGVRLRSVVGSAQMHG